SIKLNGPLQATPKSSVGAFRFTPDGSRVLFQGHVSATASGLFSIPSDGSGAPLEIGTHLVGGSVVDFQITSDGTHVVVLQGSDLSRQLNAFPVLGGTPVLLSAAHDVDEFLLTSAGDRVVYRAQTSSSHELYSAPADGSSAPVKLSGTLVSG